ncbi:MarR family winged helix-turn-helix transcriptional regulator [Sporolactobacillus laevolacticus]|uniref:MarR family transcriptional regulator n=1 Tax=Sporolactobacillus laevolacticus DSM 442 TaxID=1395513 RepID=V6IYP4_9BACL|nr:MarR family transcriptional regulator [Sporolactobacillus laevolacticus]EST12530.1 MarR family transcriptional regulator [Sporolactobacillus laevolacticus DSM 442]
MENLREMFQIMIRRFGFLDKYCCSTGGYNISLVQSHILYEIWRRPRQSIQTISETLGIEMSTFSRQIQTLVKMNLVKKSPSSDDGRVFVLSLTEEGKEVADQIDDQMNSFLDDVFSRMSAFEKETVIHSIKLLNASMAQSDRCCSPVSCKQVKE